MTNFQPGSTCSGFLLKRMKTISEIDSTVYLFEHELLGTPALAIKNNDPNKTFCIAFQTVPEDSTGVAHILEHSVLMGSKKYPVKDVFGEINKGGLMTFLNAMTGSDTTWYPFATRNLKEYFNIMDVYCDVTLNPLLLRTTFEQEGWHYHKEGGDQPLQYQGVVFNEMKGAFSDPVRSIFHHIFSGLMPESTYAHESGGDPKNIPDLTYEQFVEFHRQHYHPSNSTIFFYGDAPLEEELAYVQDNFLHSYRQCGEKAVIRQGSGISAPVFTEDNYGVQPGSELSGKTYFAVGSTIGTVLDRKRNAAFQIIANILYNSDGSPLKKAILGAGLCKDFGGFFLPSSAYKTFMMTYLVGSDTDKRDRFLDVYRTTLSAMAKTGLDHDLVLSELNKYEFSVREDMNKAQRGLDLISKALPALKHGTDPFEALQIDQLLADIRKQALTEGYFEHLIREYLLDNQATVVVTLKPDAEKMQQSMQDEQRRLGNHENSLDDSGMEQLISRTSELIRHQHRANDAKTLKLLPQLHIDDLARTVDFHQVHSEKLEGLPFLVSELNTNSVTYLELGLDCLGLSSDLLPYLDLFGTIVTEIGTKDKDYMQFAKEINICTGGFSHSFNTYMQKDGGNDLQAVLWLQVKALSRYLEQAVNLVAEVFSNVDFSDRQRIHEIVQREFAWAEHAVQSEGYGLASSRAFSHLSLAGKYNEYVSGVTGYLALKELANNYQTEEKRFLAILKKLQDLIFRRNGLTLSITSRKNNIRQFSGMAKTLIYTLPDLEPGHVKPDFENYPESQAFCTSAEVVYNVQASPLFHEPKAYNGHFEVLKTWLSRDYLWNTVRQVGGAYGCFIQFNHITGNFGVVSYRDPQIHKTYEAYNAIKDRIGDMELPDQALQQLVIGTYGNFTPHQGPATRGTTARNEYLSGITIEFKQQRIGEILATSVADMQNFAPLFAQLSEHPYRATIGNCEKIRAETNLFEDVQEI